MTTRATKTTTAAAKARVPCVPGTASMTRTLQRFFSSMPSWWVEVRPDDFTNYSCDDVLQGMLYASPLRPATLYLAEREPRGGLGDDDGAAGEGAGQGADCGADCGDAGLFDPEAELAEALALADTLDASCWDAWTPHELRLVLSADRGVWLVAWGDSRRLARACEELATWRELLAGWLVEECGWEPAEIPLGEVILLTHHVRSQVSVPPGFEDVALVGKDELPRLASRLVEVPTLAAGWPSSAAALRLVADLFGIGQVRGHEHHDAFPPELPEWMVRERAPLG